MSDDTNVEQPLLGSSSEDAARVLTHVEQGSRHSLLTCMQCIPGLGGVVFDQEDRDALWILRQRVVNEAKPSDQEANRCLLDIWNIAFPDQRRSEFAPDRDWQMLGFQGQDPKTDVRSGAWPLRQLASLASQHPDKLRRMVKHCLGSEASYIFAISCFNVSHMLGLFFDLVTTVSVSPLPHASRATRCQLKNLLSLIVAESQVNGCLCEEVCRRVMNELFVEVMTKVHCSWISLKQQKSELTLMDFHLALSAGFAANASFWKQPCRDLSDLRIA